MNYMYTLIMYPSKYQISYTAWILGLPNMNTGNRTQWSRVGVKFYCSHPLPFTLTSISCEYELKCVKCMVVNINRRCGYCLLIIKHGTGQIVCTFQYVVHSGWWYTHLKVDFKKPQITCLWTGWFVGVHCYSLHVDESTFNFSSWWED